MKKLLSLMLSFALLLTTLALPISVSAADVSGSMGEEGTAKIVVTYAAKDADGVAITSSNPVRPGESLKIDVKVKLDSETTTDTLQLDSYDIAMYYDSSYLTFVSEGSAFANTTSSDEIDVVATNYIHMVKQDSAENLTTTDQTIATLNFTVKDDSNVSAAITAGTINVGSQRNTDYTSFVDQNAAYYDSSTNLVENSASINVAANTVDATVNDQAINGQTFYTTSALTVKYTGTNVTQAELYKDDVKVGDIDATNGIATTGAGTYTVKLKAKGMAEVKTLTFTIVAEDINTTLSAELTNTGFDAGDVITVPVNITGLQSATAAKIKFDISYPTDYFTLSEDSDDVTINENTVLYENATGMSNGKVVDLKFTVKVPESGVEYGDKTITLSNPDLALVTTQINPSQTPIAISTQTLTATVIPTGDFASYTGLATSWTNATYNVTFTPVNGATLKYAEKAASAEVSTDAENLASLFSEGTATTGVVPVPADDTKTVYVVAKIGNIYKLAAKLDPATTKMDTTAPTVAITNGDMSAWATSKTITEDDIFVTDTSSKSTTKASQYRQGASGEFTDIPSEGLVINESYDGKYTIRAYDAAGNYMDTEVTIKVDADDPTVADPSVGNVEADGYKTISFTVTDISTVTVTAYSVGNDVTEAPSEGGTTLTGSEGTYTYKVNASGRYLFKAVDSVGKSTVKYVDVEFSKLSAASKMKVAVVKDTEPSAYGFYTAEKIASDYTTMNTTYGGSNGKFTYVKIAVDAAGEGYTNVVKVNNEESTATEFTAVGDYTIEITTKHNTDTTDTKTATYKFSIVAEADMPSVNNDKKYNIVDFAMMRKVVGASESGVLPSDSHNFKGGIFAGDVTGDFTMKADDISAVINAILAGQTKGNYTFAIMNHESE